MANDGTNNLTNFRLDSLSLQDPALLSRLGLNLLNRSFLGAINHEEQNCLIEAAYT